MVCFPGHNRTIHKLTFQGNNQNEITSASQDGTIKLFDLRDNHRNVRTLSQKTVALSPVRDISYCPGRSDMLVAAQENGIIVMWDVRYENRSYSSFTGHLCSIPTLNWHPEFNLHNRNWLATAGSRDHLIKVWDFNSLHSTESQMMNSFNGLKPSISSNNVSSLMPKVIHTIRTTRVNRIKWQPGPGNEMQIASSGNMPIDLNIYLWHLDRPFLPYATIDGHHDIIQAIVWDPNDSNCLYSVSKEGMLIYQNVVFRANHLLDYAPKSAIAINSFGQISHVCLKNQIGSTMTLHDAGTINPRKLSRGKLSADIKTLINNVAKEKSPRRDYIEVDSQEALLPSPTQQQLKNKRSQRSSKADHKSDATDQDTTSRDLTLAQRNLLRNEYIEAVSREKWKIFLNTKKSDIFTYNIDADALRFYVKESSQQIEFYNDFLHLTFNELALGYRLKGDSLQEVCQYNSMLCADLNEPILSQFWSILRMICSWPYETNQIESHKSRPKTKKKFNGIPEEYQINLEFNAALYKETYAPAMLFPLNANEKRKEKSLQNYHDSGDPTKTNFHCGQDNQRDFYAGVSLDDLLIDMKRRHKTLDHDDKDTSNQQTNSQDISYLSEGKSFDFFGYDKPEKIFEINKPYITSNSINDSLNWKSLDKFVSNQILETVSTLSDNSNTRKDLFIPEDPIQPIVFEENNFQPRFHPVLKRKESSPTEIEKSQTLRRDRHSNRRITHFPLKTGQFQAKYTKRNYNPSTGNFKGSVKKKSIQRGVNSFPLSPFNVANLKGHLNNNLLKKIPKSNSINGPVEQFSKCFFLEQEQSLKMDLINAVKCWMLQLVDFGHTQTVCTALLCLGVKRLHLWDTISERQVNAWFQTYLDILERFRLYNTMTLIMKKCGSIHGTADSEYYRVSNNIFIDGNISSDCEFVEEIRRFSTTQEFITKPSDEMNPLAIKIANINKTGTTFAIRCGLCQKPMPTKMLQNYSAMKSQSCPNTTTTNEAPTPAGIDSMDNLSQGWACHNHVDTRPALATCSICRSTVRGIFITCKFCNHGGHLHHVVEWWSNDRTTCPAGCGHICEYS